MNDTIEKLGELALGSRLKRISDMILADATKMYEYHHIDFKPTWFPIFHLLYDIHPDLIGITEIAKHLNVTHPFVNKITRELKQAGLILELNDKTDKRKRLIILSEKGMNMIKELEPVWNNLQLTVRNAILDNNPDFMTQLATLENKLKDNGLYKAYHQRAKTKELDEIKIHINNPDHFKHFKDLNVEWLEAYFKVEKKDTELLNKPESILEAGGYIFTAEIDNQIMGTCALIQFQPNVYELGKMGVTAAARGKQLGKRLGLATLQKAKEIGAKKVVLESNNTLKPALNLYKRLGFKFISESPFGNPSVSRADVFMEHTLNDF